MRAVPRRCQPPFRIGASVPMFFAPAVSRIYLALAMPCSIIFRLLAPIV